MADAFLAYCDESGQRDYGPKTDKFFVVASVLVPTVDAPHLEDEIRGLKRAFWVTPRSRSSRTGFGGEKNARSTILARMALV